MGCGNACCAFLLNVVNLLFLLIGLVPLVFGIIALASEKTLTTVIAFIPGSADINQIVPLSELIKSSAVYIIVLGGIIFVIGFLGFFGSCCKVRWMIYLYMLLLILILLAEIAIIVLAVAFPSTFSSGAKTAMLKSLTDAPKPIRDITVFINGTFIEPTDDALSMAWHSMQYGLKCCGVNSSMDYNPPVTWIEKRDDRALAPLTCCQHTGTDLTLISNTSFSITNCIMIGDLATEYSTKGCFDALLSWIVTSSVVIGVMAGIGALEILLIIVTCCRITEIRKEHDVK